MPSEACCAAEPRWPPRDHLGHQEDAAARRGEDAEVPGEDGGRRLFRHPPPPPCPAQRVKVSATAIPARRRRTAVSLPPDCCYGRHGGLRGPSHHPPTEKPLENRSP